MTDHPQTAGSGYRRYLDAQEAAAPGPASEPTPDQLARLRSGAATAQARLDAVPGPASVLSSSTLVYLAGVLQAVIVAVVSFLSQPSDLTGRPLAFAIAGVVVSAVLSYVGGHAVARRAAAEERGRAHRRA